MTERRTTLPTAVTGMGIDIGDRTSHICVLEDAGIAISPTCPQVNGSMACDSGSRRLKISLPPALIHRNDDLLHAAPRRLSKSG